LNSIVDAAAIVKHNVGVSKVFDVCNKYYKMVQRIIVDGGEN
jgi:hypothetical protein